MFLSFRGVWTGFGVAVAAVAFFATYISGSNRGGSSAAARQSDKKQIENGVKKVVPPSVGKGGEAVKVADMATGGSGSSAIMQGQTVAQETFKGERRKRRPRFHALLTNNIPFL